MTTTTVQLNNTSINISKLANLKIELLALFEKHPENVHDFYNAISVYVQLPQAPEGDPRKR